MFAATGITYFPKQASSYALDVDLLYFFILAINIFFAALIFLMLIVLAVRYRRTSETFVPKPIHGSVILETLWSVIPFGITIIIFVWSSSVYFTIAQPPKDATVIYVVGRQWMWKVQHPKGQKEINELHVPVGQPVKLIMTSEDVIHSFFIPDFRVKQDVLPAQYSHLWFQASEAGTYNLFCTQYCGTDHSGMIGRVVAMDPSEYQKWQSEGPFLGMAKEGGQLFLKYQCITCHSGNPQARAPSLEGIYGKQVQLKDGRKWLVDEDYIRESILLPNAKIAAGYEPIMPTFGRSGPDHGPMPEEDLLKLIEYVKSLKPGETPPRNEDSTPPAVDKYGTDKKPASDTGKK